MQNNQQGISFIEILVALLLISILLSMTTNIFFARRPRQAQKDFYAQFLVLVDYATSSAVMQKKVYKVDFDLEHKNIGLAQFDPASQATNKHERFTPIAHTSDTMINIPPFTTLKNFFINGVDELHRSVKTEHVWFYIMPDGSSQSIIMNFENEQESSNNQYAFCINPFYSRVTLHEAFQKP